MTGRPDMNWEEQYAWEDLLEPLVLYLREAFGAETGHPIP